MYKIAGILCILTGCVGLGNLKVRKDQDRIRYLRGLIHMIQRIQDEIGYGKYTLPEICLLLADGSDAWYAPYLEEIHRRMFLGDGTGLKEVWGVQMEACLRGLPLQEDEREVMIKLPAYLGAQERFGQPVELLIRKCRQSDEAYENRAKMIHSVSLLTGLLLSILLL